MKILTRNGSRQRAATRCSIRETGNYAFFCRHFLLSRLTRYVLVVLNGRGALVCAAQNLGAKLPDSSLLEWTPVL